MKIRVADYIADFLVENGITDVFSVTGGGAMHLNDALGHKEGLTCTYNHHEQACAIAAESYARVENRIAAVCVTTGPGGTNAITGVVGGYLDSIPMLVLSGQVRYDTTARSTGLPLRALGDQEFDITKAVSCMTKYCEMVVDPARIRYCLEKALYIARHGRPGPCWLDIPLNVQGGYVEADGLAGYDPLEYDRTLPLPVSDELVDTILEKIRQSKRPVLYAGNGIRLSGGYDDFRRVVDKLNIPVVTCWDSIDAIEDNHPLYAGRGGIMGDRPGNFAVQNSDLVFSIGSRLSIRQVGYHHASWARAAYTIVNDIDEAELKKPTVRIDLPVHADARDLLQLIDEKIKRNEMLFQGEDWIKQCRTWREKYPVIQKKHAVSAERVNVYHFIDRLSKSLPENTITVVGNGSACVVGSHGYTIKRGQRFLINSAIASMGYDLPAAIGACIAAGREEIVCITGDGSMQMNLQELQTIIHHRLPIKLYVINNSGYHSIRQTQKNFFGEPLVGIGADSGDLSFPDLSKLALAYGYPYFRCDSHDTLDQTIDQVAACEGPVICEIFVTIDQPFEPKSASKRLEDGTMVSAPLEDLAPFLPREELEENMYIPLWDEKP